VCRPERDRGGLCAKLIRRKKALSDIMIWLLYADVAQKKKGKKADEGGLTGWRREKESDPQRPAKEGRGRRPALRPPRE